MEQRPSWSSVTQEIPHILWNLIHKIQSMPPPPLHPITLRSILILSSHLDLGLTGIYCIRFIRGLFQDADPLSHYVALNV